MKIGMIGLGAMGLPIARCLLKAGYELYAFDVSKTALDTIEKDGACSCTSVGEVAVNVDTAFCSLPNASIVESVLKEVLAQEDAKIETWVDLSSISPESAKKFAQMAEVYKISYMDCPVSGGVHGAAAGTLTIMAGGPSETLEKVRPALNAIGKKIYHVGDVGAGSGMKMVNNFMLGCNMAAAAKHWCWEARLVLTWIRCTRLLKTAPAEVLLLRTKCRILYRSEHFQVVLPLIWLIRIWDWRWKLQNIIPCRYIWEVRQFRCLRLHGQKGMEKKILQLF